MGKPMHKPTTDVKVTDKAIDKDGVNSNSIV